MTKENTQCSKATRLESVLVNLDMNCRYLMSSMEIIKFDKSTSITTNHYEDNWINNLELCDILALRFSE